MTSWTEAVHQRRFSEARSSRASVLRRPFAWSEQIACCRCLSTYSEFLGGDRRTMKSTRWGQTERRGRTSREPATAEIRSHLRRGCRNGSVGTGRLYHDNSVEIPSRSAAHRRKLTRDCSRVTDTESIARTCRRSLVRVSKLPINHCLQYLSVAYGMSPGKRGRCIQEQQVLCSDLFDETLECRVSMLVPLSKPRDT